MTNSAPLLLAFGDSLTAGYGLQRDHAFPAQLEALLQPRSPGARVINAGVSGDTTAGALGRLPRVLSALEKRPDLAIVELGANDLLRGIPPAATRANLDAIVAELSRCGIPVLLATFSVPAPFAALAHGYTSIYDDVAAKHGAATVPFFPDGVLGHSEMVLGDRLHPNARAIDLVARGMLPAVERALAMRYGQAA